MRCEFVLRRMRFALVWLGTAVVLLTVCVVGMPSDSAVLFDDARGDTRMAVGGDALDITRVEFVDETPASVRLAIRVVSVSGPPPLAEVALHFRLGDAYWIAGWTTIVFPEAPYEYKGGFVCPASETGATDPARCEGARATIEENAYMVTLDRAWFGANASGVSVSHGRAYSTLYDVDQPAQEIDVAAGPGVVVFTKGTANGPRERDAAATNVTTGPPDTPASVPWGEAPTRDAQSTPQPGVAASWGAAMVGAWMTAARRRRLK